MRRLRIGLFIAGMTIGLLSGCTKQQVTPEIAQEETNIESTTEETSEENTESQPEEVVVTPPSEEVAIIYTNDVIRC